MQIVQIMIKAWKLVHISAMSCSLKIQGHTSLIQSLGHVISEIWGSGTNLFLKKWHILCQKMQNLTLLFFYEITIVQKWSQQKLQAISLNPGITLEFIYSLEKSIIDSSNRMNNFRMFIFCDIRKKIVKWSSSRFGKFLCPFWLSIFSFFVFLGNGKVLSYW